jgi:hypothetical protein
MDAAVSGHATSLANAAADRRRTWEQHRRLLAPITIGRPPRLVGDVIDKAVRTARTGQAAEGAIVGHAASAGRATGPVRIIREPQDFEVFADGEVLVAKAVITCPRLSGAERRRLRHDASGPLDGAGELVDRPPQPTLDTASDRRSAGRALSSTTSAARPAWSARPASAAPGRRCRYGRTVATRSSPPPPGTTSCTPAGSGT